MRREAMVGLAGAAFLAACGGGSGIASDSPPAPCPRITILADGADVTQFRPGGGQEPSTGVCRYHPIVAAPEVHLRQSAQTSGCSPANR